MAAVTAVRLPLQSPSVRQINLPTAGLGVCGRKDAAPRTTLPVSLRDFVSNGNTQTLYGFSQSHVTFYVANLIKSMNIFTCNLLCKYYTKNKTWCAFLFFYIQILIKSKTRNIFPFPLSNITQNNTCILIYPTI